MPAANGAIMRLAQLSLLLFLVACGGEATGPLGPSGGENHYRVVIGTEKEDFENVTLEIRDTSSSTVTLHLVGSVDPAKNAVDDEYALQLDIQMDKAALLAMVAPDSLTVKASSMFAPSIGGPTQEQVLYQPDASASPIITGMFFRRTCFCGDGNSGTQSFDGSIEVTQISNDEITGTLSIHLTGAVPNYNQQLDANITAEFNLAIP